MTPRRLFSGCAFKLAFSCLVSVVSLVVVVAAIEGWHWHRIRHGGILEGAAIRFDPLLGWAPVEGRSIVGHGGVAINPAGFRSLEVLPDVPTVALLGDSIAFGLGLDNLHTPSAYLAKRLAPLGLQVQNLGVPGYGIDQTYLRLRQRIGVLPDLRWVVLVVCADNDLWNVSCNWGEGKRKPLFVPEGDGLTLTGVPIRANCGRNHLDSSPLGWWVWTIFHLGPGGSDWLPRWIGDRCNSDHDTERVAERLLVATRDLVSSRGARFSAVIVSHRDELYENPPTTSWWRAALVRSEVESLDFTTFLSSRRIEPSEAYLDGLHLNEHGCQMLAEFLAARGGALEALEPVGD